MSNFLLFNFVRFDFHKASMKPCKSQKSLKIKELFARFFDRNCYCYGHTNHGVVTCTDETHHLNVSGNGGRACELRVAMHSSHGVCHTVAGGTCSHVIGVESSTCTATGCNGEVAYAVLLAPLLIGTCNGMLESGGVGGVTGDRNADMLLLHDSNTLGNVVGAVALNVGSGALGEGLLLENGDRLGVGIEGGLYVGKTVDSGNDHSGILAKTIQNYAQGLYANLICIQRDLDRTLCCCDRYRSAGILHPRLCC